MADPRASPHPQLLPASFPSRLRGSFRLSTRHNARIVDRSATGQMSIERLQRIIDTRMTHMTRLVDDLLDGSRLSGKWRLDRRELSRRDILGQMVASCRRGMEFRKQHCSMRARSDAVLAFGDPVRLAQISSNLLANIRGDSTIACR